MRKIKDMTRDLEKFKERQRQILERSEKNTILSDIGSVQQSQSNLEEFSENTRQRAAKIQKLVSQEPVEPAPNTTFLSEKVHSRMEHELEVSLSQMAKMNESPSLTEFYDITQKGNNKPFSIRISSKPHLYSRSNKLRHRPSEDAPLSRDPPTSRSRRSELEERLSDFEKNVNVIEVESQSEPDQPELLESLSRSRKSFSSNAVFADNNLLSQKYSTAKQANIQYNFAKKSADYISEEFPREDSERLSDRSENLGDVTMSDEHEFSVDPFQNKKFVNSHNLNESNFDSAHQNESRADPEDFIEQSHQIETGRATQEAMSIREMVNSRPDEQALSSRGAKEESKVIARPFEQVHSYKVRTISESTAAGRANGRHARGCGRRGGLLQRPNGTAQGQAAGADPGQSRHPGTLQDAVRADLQNFRRIRREGADGLLTARKRKSRGFCSPSKISPKRKKAYYPKTRRFGSRTRSATSETRAWTAK